MLRRNRSSFVRQLSLSQSANSLVARFPGSMLTPENLTVRPYPTTDPTHSGLEAYINADVFREAFAADIDRHTTAAMAADELRRLGRMSGGERIMLVVFAVIAGVATRNDRQLPLGLSAHEFH